MSAQTVEDEWAALATDQLLDDIVAFVRRFVVLTDEQADAVALWVLHTHALEAADTTPYLAVTSAEKRSGKTRMLEALELLVRTPMPTANISDAALFRAVAQMTPTLLLDEVDAIFGPKARDREDLRGMLNAGYRRGAVVRRMGGPKMTTLEAFPVFCAKVFAGIGRLPDTVEDRCIRIRLERKSRTEQVERFRRRDVAPEAEGLRLRAVDWASPNLDYLRDARPLLPDELDDRAQDVWEPLLAIAEMAGVSWAERARDAAAALSSGEAREDDSLGVRLLADVRRIFDRLNVDKIKTGDLIANLVVDQESPWGNWYGKTISGQALGQLLKPFGLRTMEIWVDGAKARGYRRDRLEPVWARYLSVEGAVGPAGVVGAASVAEATSTTPTAPTGLDTDGLTAEERAAVDRHPELFPVGTPIEQIREVIPSVLGAEANGNRNRRT